VISFPQIANAALISDPVDLTGLMRPGGLGLWIPTITSAQVLLRGSFDQNSANFVAIYNQNAAPVSSRWYVDAGPGSLCVSLDVHDFPFPFIKIETSVAQGAIRSFAVFSKGA
jgi:hypothetical protein